MHVTYAKLASQSPHLLHRIALVGLHWDKGDRFLVGNLPASIFSLLIHEYD